MVIVLFAENLSGEDSTDKSALSPLSDQSPSVESIRAAISKALPLLERAAAGTAENRKCFTCHGQALPVFVCNEARLRGFEIDEANFERQLDHTLSHLKQGKANYLKGKGQGGRADMAGYALWTLEAGQREPDDATAAVTDFLLSNQSKSGQWKHSSNRPPSEGSDFATTYVALRGLKTFATSEQQERLDESLKSAAKWLIDTKPTDTEDRVFQLRSLEYVNVDALKMQRLADELIAQQREDGGWAQTSEMESDAYATATALVALTRTNYLGVSSVTYQNGLRFLLESQKGDGSWHVVSRSKPFQKYFETSFPYEQDQFISTSATGWSAIALLLSLPETESNDDGVLIPSQ